MAVTIADIAEMAGVTGQTVSNVLNERFVPKQKAARERAEHIRRLAAELGYRPNAAAKATATGRFDAAALIHRADTNLFPHELFRGLDEMLSENRMHLVAARMPREQIEDCSRTPKILRELCVDGLLVHESIAIPPQVLDMIQRNHLPVVWINENGGKDCVYPDDFNGAAKVTRALIDAGHRKILFAYLRQVWNDGVPPHYSEPDRLRGYQTAMRDAGLEPADLDVRYPAPIGTDRNVWGTDADDRIERCLAVLRSPDAPTAVFCVTPESAGAWIVAAALLGKRVPADLSVATISHEEVCLTGHSISLMQIPMREVAREAVRMLVEKISRADEDIPSVAVPYHGWWGSTIAAPRQ